MGSMSASDAAPLPRLGEVFFDVRGSSRSMRLSWYSDTGVAVFSIWQGGTCTGTFRLPIDDLPRMVEALQRGPRGAALPAADGRDLTADRPRRGIAGVPADLAVTSVGGFPDYATGQQIAPPVTGEFRSLGPGDPAPGFPGYGDAGVRNTGGRSAPSRRRPACRARAPGPAPRPATATRPTPATRSDPGPTRSTGRRGRGRRSPGTPTTGRPRRPPTAIPARRPTAMTRWAAAARYARRGGRRAVLPRRPGQRQLPRSPVRPAAPARPRQLPGSPVRPAAPAGRARYAR